MGGMTTYWNGASRKHDKSNLEREITGEGLFWMR